MVKPRKVNPKRGEVYLVRLDPTLGAEIQKTRPALILQNDIFNKHSPTTLIAPLTSQIKGPTHVTKVLIKAKEGGLKADSVVLLNQIRSVDKMRLVKRLSRFAPDTMARVDLGIQVIFGLIRL